MSTRLNYKFYLAMLVWIVKSSVRSKEDFSLSNLDIIVKFCIGFDVRNLRARPY